MPLSEARQRANKKWNDANLKERYDRINLVIPKGKREEIKARASDLGLSVNAYILRLIDGDLSGIPYPGGKSAPPTGRG